MANAPHRATITHATGMVIASSVLVMKYEPHATFLDGRYRLDRLVVAHDDVTIWNATDMARGLSVQLSVFERGSAVIHEGKIAGGMFVAVDAASHAPQLELASEDAFEREPRRRRAWPLAVAGVACALIALAGYHVASSRSRPVAVSETTITAATVTAPEIATPPVPVLVNPPEPMRVVEAPVVQPPPPHHAKTAPLPVLQKPNRARLRAQPMPSTNGDPLTL